MLTVAPGTMAPCSSIAFTRMLPLCTCATTGAAIATNRIAQQLRIRLMCVLLQVGSRRVGGATLTKHLGARNARNLRSDRIFRWLRKFGFAGGYTAGAPAARARSESSGAAAREPGVGPREQ